jgi:hypothetical protein
LKKVWLTPLPPRLLHTKSALFSFYCVRFSQGTPRFLKNALAKNHLANISKITNSRSDWLSVQAEAFAESVFQKSPPPGILWGW